MADYWAKIYIEIIDDPKMATMPDRLWRRTIELFLLAKKFNHDGHLPNTKQLAWVLRMATDDLDLDLKQIAQTGIIKPETDGWFVVHFEKRQAASTSTERSQQLRKRTQSNQYYDDDATSSQRFVAQSTETEQSRADTQPPQDNIVSGELAPLAKAFCDAANLPPFTPNPKSYIESLGTMFKAGVEPQDVSTAIQQLQRKEYSIVGPQSIVNASITCMGARKSKGNGHQPEPMEHF